MTEIETRPGVRMDDKTEEIVAFVSDQGAERVTVRKREVRVVFKHDGAAKVSDIDLPEDMEIGRVGVREFITTVYIRRPRL